LTRINESCGRRHHFGDVVAGDQHAACADTVHPMAANWQTGNSNAVDPLAPYGELLRPQRA